MKSSLLEKYGNIRVFGFVLFVLASIFCLYKIYDLQGKPSDAYKKPIHTTTLKLVSVVGRHGDRAPSGNFPPGDKHDSSKIEVFWPNGFANLTDIGRMRQFRIGLELRKRYRDYLTFSSSSYLAFSSAFDRCRESLQQTLQGLFQIQWPIERARKFVDDYNLEKSCLQPNSSAANKTCQDRLPNGRTLYLPSGSGSPSEFKNITIDLNTVPTLDWRYLESCKYFKAHPPSVMTDLMSSKSIASLKGITKLAELLKKTYKMNFDTHAANLWSTINEELRLARTTESVSYGNHFYGWINEKVPDYKPNSAITYFDLLAQVSNLYFKERLVDSKTRFIELGPIVTSLVQSQKQALGQNETVIKLRGTFGRQFSSLDLYANKKAVFYSTHDGTLQSLMDLLNMTHSEMEFEARFNKWRKADDVEKNLAGLKTVEFGASLIFELYETEMKEREKGVWRTTKKFAYLQANFYNEEDVITKPIHYKRLKLGAMCKDKFKKIYGNSATTKQALKENFYDEDFPLESEYSCPFELFKNITSAFMINQTELTDLCIKK